VQRAQVTDTAWLGRLAETLGAREHDNVFPLESGYGYAYQALLDCLSESRKKTTLAQATGHDEIASTPGYLHVYHVLTTPFDSERLMALTRSRTYHQLAESILARSKENPAIVIPAENREWWERTAMAGQHKPMSDVLPAAPGESPPDGSWKLLLWFVWIVVVLGFNLTRCSDYPKYSTTSSRTTSVPAAANPQSTVMDIRRTLRVPLDTCDPQTRIDIYSRVYELRRGRLLHDIPPSERVAEENDPEVVSLLQKCQPPSP